MSEKCYIPLDTTSLHVKLDYLQVHYYNFVSYPFDQGLRGYAIAMVLLFHFFPEHFPLGYLGVDVWVLAIFDCGQFQKISVNSDSSFSRAS